MTSLTLRARGPVSPDEAWERYADLDRWASWAPQIRRVEAPRRRLTPGSRGRVVGPLGVSVTFAVEDVDEPGRTWSWRATLGPVRLHLHHAVWSDGDGAATSLRVSGPLPVVLGYAPLARFALSRLVAAGP